MVIKIFTKVSDLPPILSYKIGIGLQFQNFYDLHNIYECEARSIDF